MDRLETAHFNPEPDTGRQSPPLAKFFRQFSEPRVKLLIEFFTDKPLDNAAPIQLIDNMYVPAQPGIGRALTVYRTVKVEAVDLSGARKKYA